jgi:hypothetical protein
MEERLHYLDHELTSFIASHKGCWTCPRKSLSSSAPDRGSLSRSGALTTALPLDNSKKFNVENDVFFVELAFDLLSVLTTKLVALRNRVVTSDFVKTRLKSLDELLEQESEYTTIGPNMESEVTNWVLETLKIKSGDMLTDSEIAPVLNSFLPEIENRPTVK